MFSNNYLMESDEEILRLEFKTDPEEIRRQAHWCGLRPGMRILDVGCGTGKTTSILHEMCRPGGDALGLDFSEERIAYAHDHYGRSEGIRFQVHDLKQPLKGLGSFDLIWVRFILEYYRAEGPDIVRHLTAFLKPGGWLCLLDLDHNCLNHYELPPGMARLLAQVMGVLESEYNFDPYAGRKLYAYLYDAGCEDIQVEMAPHHLLYGEIRAKDVYNWLKKVQMAVKRAEKIFEDYPGGPDGFVGDFEAFFRNPRRFTYTPLILCKGKKPISEVVET